MSIKTILADDHAVVIDGIKSVVNRKAKMDIEIIGVASDGMELLEIAQKTPADVYVLDISMPRLNGIEAAERLMIEDPKSKIIILSMHDDKKLVEKAIKSGVKGYILKENATEEVINAIHEVYEDRCYFSPKASKYLVEELLGRENQDEKGENDTATVTLRERDVLRLIAEGNNSREIAEKLEITFNTVLRHRNNIMQKLGIHTQAGLIRYALQKGISRL